MSPTDVVEDGKEVKPDETEALLAAPGKPAVYQTEDNAGAGGEFFEVDYDDEEKATPDIKDSKVDFRGEVEVHELYQDMYTMLFISRKIWCLSGIYALIVFALKMSFFSFIMADLLMNNPEGNPFGVPPGITTGMRVAQFLTLSVAVAMQEDLVKSIFLFNVRYDESIMEQAPGASRGKFLLSQRLRLIDGLYSLAVNFCLLMQADRPGTLFLNFAALQFLQSIDDIAFQLALKGYLVDEMEDCAKMVTILTLPLYPRRLGWKNYLDTMFFMFFYVIIFVFWIVVTLNQADGDFLCQTVVASFGDRLVSSHGSARMFDGAYSRVDGFHISRRTVYASGTGPNSLTKGVFAYCGQDEYWTFTLTDKEIRSVTENDICRYHLRSPEASHIFEITEIPASDWFYHNNGRDEPVETFDLFCSICQDGSDCSNNGECEQNRCTCSEGYFGPTCAHDLGSTA